MTNAGSSVNEYILIDLGLGADEKEVSMSKLRRRNGRSFLTISIVALFILLNVMFNSWEFVWIGYLFGNTFAAFIVVVFTAIINSGDVSEEAER